MTVGTPGQRTSAPTPTGRSSDSDDGNAFVAIFFLILVVLVLFWIISMGTMRSQWKKQSRRPARSRATHTRRPVDPALPYDTSRTAAPEPHDSPDPAPGSAGPSEAAAPRSDSRFAPPSGPA